MADVLNDMMGSPADNRVGDLGVLDIINHQ